MSQQLSCSAHGLAFLLADFNVLQVMRTVLLPRAHSSGGADSLIAVSVFKWIAQLADAISVRVLIWERPALSYFTIVELQFWAIEFRMHLMSSFCSGRHFPDIF